jgi:hypothetical protein
MWTWSVVCTGQGAEYTGLYTTTVYGPEVAVTDKTGTPLQAAFCDRISLLCKSSSHPNRPSLTYKEVKQG